MFPRVGSGSADSSSELGILLVDKVLHRQTWSQSFIKNYSVLLLEFESRFKDGLSRENGFWGHVTSSVFEKALVKQGDGHKWAVEWSQEETGWYNHYLKTKETKKYSTTWGCTVLLMSDAMYQQKFNREKFDLVEFFLRKCLKVAVANIGGVWSDQQWR